MALLLHCAGLMRKLEVFRSGDEWYVALAGTFVVGFIGYEAEQRAREQLSHLRALLELHSDVSTVSTQNSAGQIQKGELILG
jgi:hypothetical protein